MKDLQQRRGGLKKLSAILPPLLMLLVLNLAGALAPGHWDLTPQKRFSLDTASLRILKQLPELTTVSVYASDDMPYRFARRLDRLRELLHQMRKASKNQLIYEFPDPETTGSAGRTAAQKEGLRPVIFRVRARDALQEKKGYLGLVIRCGGQREVIPYLDPSESLEYKLIKSLRGLHQSEATPVCAWLEGYGSVSLASTGGLPDALEGLIKLKSWPLQEIQELPQSIKTMAWAQPQDSIPEFVWSSLNRFLKRGGRLLIAASPAQARSKQAQVTYAHTGLSKWLRHLGLRLSPHVVIDQQCGQLSVRYVEAGGEAEKKVPFPYFPAIRDMARHPVTSGLSEIIMPYAVMVGTYPHLAKGVEGSTIMVSSQQSGRRTLPFRAAWNRDWRQSDFESQNLPVGLAVEGPLLDDAPSNRLVLLGSGELIRQRGSALPPDHIRLFANALEWLSPKTSLSALRGKTADVARLPEVDDATRRTVKWLNFLGPVCLLMLLGGAHHWIERQREKRIHRF